MSVISLPSHYHSPNRKARGRIVLVGKWRGDVDRLNKVPEVAEKLGISEKTVWAWIGARRLAVHRVGRSVRVPESEIRRILDDGYTPAQERQ